MSGAWPDGLDVASEGVAEGEDDVNGEDEDRGDSEDDGDHRHGSGFVNRK